MCNKKDKPVEKATSVGTELKRLIQCPRCKTGNVVHVGDHYYCATDRRLCGFMMRSDQYGIKVTKGMMRYIVKNGFNEPMGIDMDVFRGKDPVNGFIVINKEGLVDFKFPKDNPVCKCPKCGKQNIIMKYSDRNESHYYGCQDYKDCKLTLPFDFRGKGFYFKEIQKLCSKQILSKEFVSQRGQKYTADIFLNDKFKIETTI